MARADLYDYFVAHSCEFEQIPEYNKGSALKVINPKTGGYSYMDLPADEKRIKHFAACRACIRLGIPVPGESKHLEELSNHLDENLPKLDEIRFSPREIKRKNK